MGKNISVIKRVAAAVGGAAAFAAIKVWDVGLPEAFVDVQERLILVIGSVGVFVVVFMLMTVFLRRQ